MALPVNVANHQRKHLDGVAAALPIDLTGGDVDLETTSGGIWVGTEGDLEVLLVKHDAPDETVVIPSVPSGSLLPLIAKKIIQAGTTATGIVAFYR